MVYTCLMIIIIIFLEKDAFLISVSKGISCKETMYKEKKNRRIKNL
jgi:hypothetical protein